MQLAYLQHKWHLNARVSTSNFTSGRSLLSTLSTIKCNTHKSLFQQDINKIAKILTKYKDKNGLNNFWYNLNLLLGGTSASFLQLKNYRLEGH